MPTLAEDRAIEEILERDSRYPRDAYEFVCEALEFAFNQRKKSAARKTRHVSGKELLEGVRLYALDQFGPLALTVFGSWNLKTCRDIGEVVFNLVDKSLLGVSEGDSREDFKVGYDFEEAFRRPFEPTVPFAAGRLTRSRRVRASKTA